MFTPIAEAAGYDLDAIALFPWKLVALAGTWGDALLPVLILLGLFTRLASAGMIGFIVVMTIVDIGFHGVDATAIGAPFDRVQDSPIWDQRLLWTFPLFVLMLNGAGRLSLDAVLAGRRKPGRGTVSAAVERRRQPCIALVDVVAEIHRAAFAEIGRQVGEVDRYRRLQVDPAGLALGKDAVDLGPFHAVLTEQQRRQFNRLLQPDAAGGEGADGLAE